MSNMLLGQLLKHFKIIGDPQIQEALQYQQDNPGVKIGEALMAMGYINDEQLCKALSKQLSIPMVKLDGIKVPQDVLDAIPAEVVHEYNVLPIKRRSRGMILASANPFDIFVLDELRFRLGFDVEVVLAPASQIEQAIAKHYGAKGGVMERMYEELTQSDISFGRSGGGGGDDDDDGEGDDAPVIKLVAMLITDAVRKGASDIHVEPMERKLRIRLRVDGVCQEIESPPKRLQGSIVQRLKLMARMNIAEKRLCQDGRIKMGVEGRDIDLRVSDIPTRHGESIVMRILDKEKSLVDMETLGFSEHDMQRFDLLIKRPNGIILVTGPTGSGKTTTLYATLKKLNKPNVKIITAEDPVEYHLDGINQCEVRHNIELTFARILRAMLRQAPNIILVGEIRDKETAEIAIQASLTGHMVFSTLHTNDAPTAITRLVDMGVKPFLVASSIQGIMAQRLIRMLCTKCKKPYVPTEVELRMVGLKPDDVAGASIFRAVGCRDCYEGYRGRRGIYEIMNMNVQLREMIFRTAPIHEIRAVSRSNGMTTLMEDGLRKVMAGLTTLDEVLAHTHRQDLVMS